MEFYSFTQLKARWELYTEIQGLFGLYTKIQEFHGSKAQLPVRPQQVFHCVLWGRWSSGFTYLMTVDAVWVVI